MSARHVSLCSPLNRRILEALEQMGPMHSYALADWMGVGRKTITTRDYLPALHAAGLIHIVRWMRAPELTDEYGMTRGPAVRIYAIGSGPDARRPKPFSAAENAQRQRARNPERFVRQRIARHGLRVVDPLLAALMGGAR